MGMAASTTGHSRATAWVISVGLASIARAAPRRLLLEHGEQVGEYLVDALVGVAGKEDRDADLPEWIDTHLAGIARYRSAVADRQVGGGRDVAGVAGEDGGTQAVVAGDRRGHFRDPVGG